MGCSKSSFKREICNDIGLPQEKEKKSNKQFNFMPKEIRKRKTKKVSRMNEITKIRVEIDERD